MRDRIGLIDVRYCACQISVGHAVMNLRPLIIELSPLECHRNLMEMFAQKRGERGV